MKIIGHTKCTDNDGVRVVFRALDLKVFRKIVFSCNYKNGSFWFRILGYGLHIKNITKFPLLFSQRNGLKKSIRIKNTYIEYLTKVR